MLKRRKVNHCDQVSSIVSYPQTRIMKVYTSNPVHQHFSVFSPIAFGRRIQQLDGAESRFIDHHFLRQFITGKSVRQVGDSFQRATFLHLERSCIQRRRFRRLTAIQRVIYFRVGQTFHTYFEALIIERILMNECRNSLIRSRNGKEMRGISVAQLPVTIQYGRQAMQEAGISPPSFLAPCSFCKSSQTGQQHIIQ